MTSHLPAQDPHRSMSDRRCGRSVAQLEQGVSALDHLVLIADEIAAIDRDAVDGGIDLWRARATS